MADPPSPFRLSVLDQAPIAANATGGQALRQVIDLAQAAERWGYHRYWIAEHHATPGLASASPEILVGPVAMATRRIRVGTGGVMLPHYSPFKVAESFSMLAGLAPGRIDLGIGRAPGTDGKTAYALQRDRRERAPDDFPQQLAEVLAYLDDTMPEGHPFAPLSKTLPGLPESPVPWLLGSSADSAVWAAGTGLPYCIADFINPRAASLAARYRADFAPQPKRGFDRPYVAIALWVICAETDAEAERLAKSWLMFFRLLRRGELIAVPSPEDAAAFLEKDGGGAIPLNRRVILGSPETVKARITAAAAEYEADEVMVINIMYDHAERLRSYRLVAEAFGMVDTLAPASPHPEPFLETERLGGG